MQPVQEIEPPHNSFKVLSSKFILQKYLDNVQRKAEPPPSSNNQTEDDADHNLIIKPGILLCNDRYQILYKLGQGSFGIVVCALDLKKDIEVAIKIIKGQTPFTRQANIEISILQTVNKYDIDDTKNIVRLLNTFTHGKHRCLVFEKLQDDLYSILKKRHFKPFSLTIIKSITYQLMNTLVYLADKNVNIIHCDIKPENILLQKEHQASVKLIDFGSSCVSSKTMYTYIQSRYYRSPEILLGLHYNTQIDIWSLGCVMAELFTGNPLFPGNSSQDQMSQIIAVCGMPSQELIEKSKNKEKFFIYDEKNNIWVLKKPLPKGKIETLESRLPNRNFEDLISYRNFIDLLKQIFVIDPSKRITPRQAKKHQFLYYFHKDKTLTDKAGTEIGRRGGGVGGTEDSDSSSHNSKHRNNSTISFPGTKSKSRIKNKSNNSKLDQNIY